MNVQASLERVGIDPAAAVSRARAASRSRVGRKRTRGDGEDQAGDAMDMAEAPRRVHSSKSRCFPLLLGHVTNVQVVTGPRIQAAAAD